MPKKTKNFEQSLARLNEVVLSLEKGDRPLSESMALFEEGAGLVKDCSRMLDEAEQKVSLLKRDLNDNPMEVEYDAAE